MPRNKAFHPDREPFRHTDKINLAHPTEAVHGPISFLNPTRAHFHHVDLADPTKQSFNEKDDPIGSSNSESEQSPEVADGATVPASEASFLWRSRDNRKGRHPLVVKRPKPGEEAKFQTPPTTKGLKPFLRTVWRMLFYFPVWDISWCVAYIFTWGSIVWVINAFFVWLPFVKPSSEFNNEILYGGGITAFIGAVLFFEFGSVLLMFEAINENKSGCFGWAVEELMEGDEESKSKKLRIHASHGEHCSHHHKNKHNFVGTSASTTSEAAKPPSENIKGSKSWQWLPSWQMLRDHYFHEIGFLACLSQFLGATIFSIAGITALPGINNHMSQGLLDGIYWVPQVIGGCGFIISGLLFMVETQKNWYTPAFGVLGWHYAFWNEVGGIGFTLSGALGMAYGNSGAEYEASLATFWGSWAFLIGSLMQLYEAVDKNPVEEVPADAESKDIVQASKLSF